MYFRVIVFKHANPSTLEPWRAGRENLPDVVHLDGLQ